MTKTMLNIKTDAKLKKQAQMLAKEIGVPLSIVINAELKRFVSERRVALYAPLIPNAQTLKMLEAAEEELKQGKAKGPFDSLDAMFESLQE